MSTDSLVLAATPTVEEWLEVCEPGLRKVFVFGLYIDTCTRTLLRSNYTGDVRDVPSV